MKNSSQVLELLEYHPLNEVHVQLLPHVLQDRHWHSCYSTIFHIDVRNGASPCDAAECQK